MSAIYRSEAAGAAVHAAYRAVLDGWPVSHEERRVPTGQGETFVVACGPPGAPALVLLHGAQANAATWMFDSLAWSQRFRLYAIDMIGEAGFSAPSRPDLASDAYARWLDEVLDGLGVARAAIVGVSLGGWLALDYATRRPGRVERLALLCPAGIGRQMNFRLKALPLMLLGPWGRRKMRELVFGPAPAPGAIPAIARPLVELMRLIGASVLPRRVKIPRLSDADLAGLPKTLVIVGGKDVLIDSVDTRRRLDTHAPLVDVRYLPEARHFIPGQSGAILAFLTS
jgi:pimeloyl-ACP methyl ester carboxylesterase